MQFSTSQLPSQHVLVEMNEVFEEVVDGRFEFSGTVIVYQVANTSELHHAFSKARYSSSPSDINIEEHFRDNDIRIPVSVYNPSFQPSLELTRVPDPIPSDSFIKKPRLINYDQICKGPQPTLIADSLLQEATVCEFLLKHTKHPNIATYLGCQVSDDGGRITGLCFARYRHTLMQEVNPNSFMKRESRATRQTTTITSINIKDYYSGVLAGIESGIRHLHSLGLVHNDINPSNIMLDGDRAVIIDFGSCRPVGEAYKVLAVPTNGTMRKSSNLFLKMTSVPWGRFGYG